ARAKPLAESEARAIRVSNEYAGAARHAHCLLQQEPDCAGAHYQSPAVLRDRDQRNSMQGHRNCLQKRRIMKRQILRKAMNNAGRNRHKLRECSRTTVITAGDAQNLSTVAEIDLAAQTVRALPAIHGRVEGNAIAFREAADALADPGDNACCLMSHDDRSDPASR